jgi:VWFA-related protein
MEILTMRRGVIAASMLAAALTARVAAQVTFRTSTTLVVQTVTVTDADGRPIEGLTASDFLVTEDGVPQTLSFVDYQTLSGETAPPLTTAAAEGPVTAPEVAPVTSSAIASSTIADAQYRDRRLLVFYFDFAGMGQADRIRALQSANRYVRSRMGVADLVAILTFQGDMVRVKQDFTDDRARLLVVIQTLLYGEDRDGDGIPDDPIDEGTAFGQNSGEFNFLRTDRQLAALQTAVSMLKPLPEQKTLLFFVSGLNRSGLDNQAQMTATVNAALRANVSINPIDARGLVAEAPLGGADVPSPGGIGMLTGAAAQGRRDRFAASQDSLYSLAKDTGGDALLDDNDLARGITRAAAAVKSYYILGYYSTRTEKDGRFRRVKVSVAGHPSAKLAYRQGYFGEKAFKKFTGADKERQLEDALMLGDPITEIPMAMEVNYFQINRNEYFVPVSLKIPGDELMFDRDQKSTRAQIDLIGEIKDERGVTVQNVRDKLDIPLTADRAAELTSHPVQYETGFTLLPGQYALKLLARDAVSGRIGTFQSAFTVPNLTRETTTVRMSSVVLSSQRVGRDDALFAVRQKIVADAANPLVSNGTKLLPSVTRVFSASRDLYVRFDVYRMDAVTNGPLLAFVSLYKDGQIVFDSAPVKVDVGSAVTPFRFTVPLTRLAPGAYDCQVSVLDLGQQKARFWRAPIVVVR